MPDLRQRLLDLVDRKAFEPVLEKSPDDYGNERDRARLKDLQKTTRSTQESYHDNGDAEGVRAEFKGDLNSEAAKKVHGELRSLGLPTLADIEDEFERIYREAQSGG